MENMTVMDNRVCVYKSDIGMLAYKQALIVKSALEYIAWRHDCIGIDSLNKTLDQSQVRELLLDEEEAEWNADPELRQFFDDIFDEMKKLMYRNPLVFRISITSKKEFSSYAYTSGWIACIRGLIKFEAHAKSYRLL
jgi:hypothetical protein